MAQHKKKKKEQKKDCTACTAQVWCTPFIHLHTHARAHTHLYKGHIDLNQKWVWPNVFFLYLKIITSFNLLLLIPKQLDCRTKKASFFSITKKKKKQIRELLFTAANDNHLYLYFGFDTLAKKTWTFHQNRLQSYRTLCP